MLLDLYYQLNQPDWNKEESDFGIRFTLALPDKVHHNITAGTPAALIVVIAGYSILYMFPKWFIKSS